MLEELLDYIVAENIGHQLYGIGVDLAENLILLIAISGFELQLNES